MSILFFLFLSCCCCNYTNLPNLGLIKTSSSSSSSSSKTLCPVKMKWTDVTHSLKNYWKHILVIIYLHRYSTCMLHATGFAIFGNFHFANFVFYAQHISSHSSLPCFFTSVSLCFSFRVLFCAIMAAVSFLLVSFSSAVWMSILGKDSVFL